MIQKENINIIGIANVFIVDKKQKIYLGVYSDLDETKKVRYQAEEKYFGKFRRKEEDIVNE